MIKIHGITYESLLEDEENQIHGFVHVIDSSGMGFHYLTIFTPHEAYRIGKNLEVGCDNRTMSLSDFNYHLILEIIANATQGNPRPENSRFHKIRG